MAVDWWLYVDESGRFDVPDDPVAVAGVLARDGAPATSSQALAAELKRIAPGHPWPLHASCYNLPLVHGLGTVAARRDGAGALALGGQIYRALCEHRDLLARIERDLVAGKEPRTKHPEPSLKALDDVLRARRRDLWILLRDHADELRAAMARVLRVVCARQDTHVVIASETVCGDGVTYHVDRYIGVLLALCERAAAIVARSTGEHRIRLVPLQRDVRTARRPKVAGPINHIEMTMELRALELPPIVKVTFDSSPRWTAQMHACLVLSDFVANRSRRPLGSPDSLLITERRVKELLLVAPRSTERSHLTASGRARQVLVAPADVPVVRGALRPNERRWAWEQAQEWRS